MTRAASNVIPFRRRPVSAPASKAESLVVRAEDGFVRLEVSPGNWLALTPTNARVWAHALGTLADTADAQRRDERKGWR